MKKTNNSNSNDPAPNGKPANVVETSSPKLSSLIESALLTPSDIEALSKSWITGELAERAGIRRVDSLTGAELIGRTPKANVDYAGLVFPYFWPGDTHAREYRLRRDHPDLERGADGKTKVKNKYMAPPGRGNLIYFPPGVTASMLADPAIPIVITEGEKKDLALSRFFSEREELRVVISLSGVWNWRGTVGKETDAGGKRQDVKGVISDFDRIDWHKREVEIVFDTNVKTNQVVAAARRELAKELLNRGAVVIMVDLPDNVEGVNGVDDLLFVKGPDLLAKLFEDARQKFAKRQVKTMAGNITFMVSDKGVYATDAETGDKTWVCSPLYIEADTRDQEGDNWGRLLRFMDPDGREHKWAMPMSLLSGDGGLYRERLLDMGLVISPITKARNLLGFYLSTQPTKRVRCVNKIGWHGEAYTLPDETIGGDDGEEIYLQATETNPLLRTAGTLEEWQESISHYCIGNTRLVFSVSLACAAALLGIVGEEGGGFHFRGDSSEGKTTTLYVAGSVWGGGSEKGFMKKWKATGNGLENVSACHNDSLLCLDEIAECNPHEIGSIAYMLANGQGKIRNHRGYQNRPLTEWRLLFLSSGEISLADLMGQVGQRIKGGQEVRFVNIRANAGVGYGLFEDLHGFKNGEDFSKHLVACAKRFYGLPIRVFIKYLSGRHLAIRLSARTFIKSFKSEIVPASAGAEVGRVANRFALAAFAGELATEQGVTGWNEGEAKKAAAQLFEEWLKDRGTLGSSEAEHAVRQVRAFLEAHGSSRFQSRDEQIVINRVGFKVTNKDGEIEYLIQQEQFAREVCAGFDPEFVARTLFQRGCLVRQAAQTKGYTVPRRVPDIGRKHVYVINSKIFELKPGHAGHAGHATQDKSLSEDDLEEREVA
jgi:uncharacterized protein (DUF927 family)